MLKLASTREKLFNSLKINLSLYLGLEPIYRLRSAPLPLKFWDFRQQI